MNPQKAYNEWAATYDTAKNKTRDLEHQAIKETLQNILISNCLEIGCGTGKNSGFLRQLSQELTSVDFSESMLSIAKKKYKESDIKFIQTNILSEWDFCEQNSIDLICFSLVLEHINDLEYTFNQCDKVLRKNGLIYIGELHPIKQYLGSKAKFDTPGSSTKEIEAYTHHLSDYLQLVTQNYTVIQINEYFDDYDKSNPPRIIAVLLQKTGN